jgi:uncharacterized protein YraI
MWHKMIWTVLLMLMFGATAQAAPAATDSGVFWNTEIFNNSYLTDPSVLKRSDGGINFDWGTGSPASGVNADNFSVRFGADPYFAAGTYRFYVLADDYVRVNIGYAFQPQINSIDVDKRVGVILTADVTLTEGVHHIQIDYQEFLGNAYLFFSWANLATNPTGPNFAAPSYPTTGVNTAAWTAQYYANPALIGTPSVIQTESEVSKNWGGLSPSPVVPSDNFSARWASVQTLGAGAYTLSVSADDGFRVYVDGVLVLNEWHNATAQTYSASLNLTAGQHSFVVEYYEASGNAFITYVLQGQAPPSVSPPVSTGTVATINTGTLNLRANPDVSAAILLKMKLGGVYVVVGMNSDSSWVQLNVNGTTGWALARYVVITGNSSVPVTNTGSAFSAPADTGYDVRALDTVNVRSEPSRRATILAKMPLNGTARVIGRTASNRWWQVNFNGVIGWVSSTYAEIVIGADTSRIPITGA